MLKRILLAFVIGMVVAVAFIGWRFFTSNTKFSENRKYLYVRTGHTNKHELMKSIQDSNFVRNPGSFEVIAEQLDVWERLRPGRYEVKKGASLFDIARMLRNNQQSAVNLVITKLRTKEQLAGLVGRKFECDSASFIEFLNNSDTVRKLGFDSSTVMTTIFPNTYTYFWSSEAPDIYRKLFAEYKRVWNEDRKRLAGQQSLNPTTAYILASIIEEETNLKDEKGTMASVYLNRLKTGMRLGADPTVKFALRDFGLRRIYEKHLAVESPYNTYKHAGLPPGPICTPSLQTIDAVLNAPQTNYLYFVVKNDFSRHVFTEDYNDHLKYRKEYQEALTALQKRKQQTEAKPQVTE